MGTPEKETECRHLHMILFFVDREEGIFGNYVSRSGKLTPIDVIIIRKKIRQT